MPGAGSASWTSMVQPPGMFRCEGVVHPSASMSVEQATSRVLAHAGVSQAATGGAPGERRELVERARIGGWGDLVLERATTAPAGYDGLGQRAHVGHELVRHVHGWDMAQGSGQTLHVSDALVAYVRTLAETVVPGGRDRGSFEDEVTPAPDASPLDQLAAFAGRTPVAA